MNEVQPNSSSGPAGDGPAPLVWVDGRNRTWRIFAAPSGISLEGPDGGFRVPRESFEADLYVSPAGDHVVVRLSGPDDEVGFLVSRPQAQELLARLGAHPQTPDERMEAERQAAVARRPNWPKMTGMSIWALICAALAFVPFVGLAFAAIAVGLLLGERGRLCPGAAWLHVRWMARISVILVVWGVAVCLFSSWTWLQPAQFSSDQWIEAGDYAGSKNWLVIGISIVVVLLSLSAHEASHAISAWWCGDDYARSLGRVTLSPLAHIDLFGTVALPLILALAGAPVFGYARPVPVQLAGVRRFRRAHILISIAGPGSNLLLAALALSVLLAATCLLRLVAPYAGVASCADLLSPVVHLSGFRAAPVVAVLLTALKLTFLINTFLAAFNLIPLPPLDGSWVLEHLLPNSLGRILATIRPFGFIVFLVLLWADVLHWFLLPAYLGMAVTAILFSWCVAI